MNVLNTKCNVINELINSVFKTGSGTNSRKLNTTLPSGCRELPPSPYHYVMQMSSNNADPGIAALLKAWISERLGSC